MKPVDQTVFGDPTGNCFSACVASLLGLSIEDVPWFNGHADWYAAFRAWLRPRGYYPVTFRLDSAWRPDGYAITGGRSPRATSHAVVTLGLDVVHDPHPSREGLVRHEDVTVLVPFDAAAWRLEERVG